MKKPIATAILLASSSLATPLSAAELDITLTNLTQNIAFTPVLVAAHGNDFSLFSVGEEASTELQAMAEGGALGGLMELAQASGVPYAANIANGPLLATVSATYEGLDTGDEMYLSLVAMLLPTNDGFVGLDSWMIPSQQGTYTVYLNGYDAGTEANNELVVEGGGALGAPGIPDAPLFEHGQGGVGVTDMSTNEKVHIHPGNLGDAELNSGLSDLDNRVHRWLNPVAKLTITVR